MHLSSGLWMHSVWYGYKIGLVWNVPPNVACQIIIAFCLPFSVLFFLCLFVFIFVFDTTYEYMIRARRYVWCTRLCPPTIVHPLSLPMGVQSECVRDVFYWSSALCNTFGCEFWRDNRTVNWTGMYTLMGDSAIHPSIWFWSQANESVHWSIEFIGRWCTDTNKPFEYKYIWWWWWWWWGETKATTTKHRVGHIITEHHYECKRGSNTHL